VGQGAPLNPSIHWRAAAWALWIAACAALALKPAAHAWDLLLYDAATRLAAQWRHAVEDDVVVVALDETTVQRLEPPIAPMQGVLGPALEGLAHARAKAVVVDLILPDRSFDSLVPGLDDKLLLGIVAMRRAGPLVLAITVDEGGRSRPVHAPFVAAAGPGGTGFALFEADADAVVRRFDERLGVGGESVPTLVGQLVRRLSQAPGAGLIDFTRRAPVRTVAMHDMLAQIEARDNAALARAFAGKVVFIGMMLPFVDRHRVPAARAPHTVPGVIEYSARTYRNLYHARMKTTLDINDTLLASAKALAARQRTSLTRLIEEGLQLRLRSSRVAKTAGKPKLRVYRGRGGLVAGVNPASNKAMLEAAGDDT
jgi:CHASE2 domain-containing sensor protein